MTGKKSVEIDKLKNQLLRALADFDNFKKRTTQEREQFVKFANEGLITELLPVLDGFGRAFAAAEQMLAGSELAKGLALIKCQLEDVLKKNGVAEVVALDQSYDPTVHEAILQKESDRPEGIIIEEMQKGYTLNGKLIRPSMVIVAKGQGG